MSRGVLTKANTALKKIIVAVNWFLCVVCIIGCTSAEKTVTLTKAEKLYNQISLLRGNPQKNLMRSDWPAWYRQFPEGIYLYSVPYVPYAIYNSILVYLKEGITSPGWPILPYTSHMDQPDQWVTRASLTYQRTFVECWPYQNSQANLVNMDVWEQQNQTNFSP